MIENQIQRLNYLMDIIPPLLKEIGEDKFNFKPNPEKWSKKEIIGHLIDSVTNNHHRLIRGQFEDVPTVFYDQNLWNKYGYYNQIDGKQIISFWTIYNKQLLELILKIPNKNWLRKCNVGEGKILSLESILESYLEHLEHHLKQVVDY